MSDLVHPTSEMARVIGAVAKGDLSKAMALDIDGRPLEGEFLRTAKTVNRMVDQLGSFASEVTRVAREVGTEGKLGGQAEVKGVAGTWKDLTDSVNSMAGNLTGQVRNIAEVTTAVANGDLSKKITVDVRGEFLELKDTINTMVDQLRSFASEVTRVAREVGTEGKLGGQARVEGVSGTWKDLTDSVNFMAGNLTAQVRNIAAVTTAVATGDLSKKITVDVKGEILELKNTINTMVDQLSSFAAEVTRVAREVGTEGKLGGQADVKGVAGTWKDLTDSVNFMASNLTAQVRNIAAVTTAVATGDLSKKITVDVKGEILELKNTINTMVDQLSSFAAEVTRVAREVGTEGKLGGQADVKGVAGTWKDLTDNVNFMASNLTAQVRNIAEVTTAVANGDLSKKIAVDVRGEILELKNTINTMVDQLRAFASEVTRVAREVGTEGKLGGQADVRDVAGTWKDLTDSVNFMASNLTGQVRNIAEVTKAVASGDLSKKITVDVKGEILELKNTINTMVDQLSSFAAEVTRVAREVGTEGKLGGQADVKGVAGTWKDLTDSVNFMAEQSDRPGAQHRRSDDRRRSRRLVEEDHGGRARRNPGAEKHDQHDGRSAPFLRGRSDPRGPRSGDGRKTRRAGRRARRGRHVERPDRQRELDGRQPDWPGAQHRRSDHGRGQRRLVEEDHRRRASGEILELKNTINTMVDQLRSFAAEVTRVAREVGTEGKLGGQAEVKGVAGTWKDLTDNVNFMAGNLTGQVRNIAAVTKAVASGDLSKKITVDVRGEILELKDTINTMVDQLRSFASEVTRVAREVGTEGKLGGQADVRDVAGTWKDLTDNVNFMAGNLTGQVRNIAEVTKAVASGDLSKKITVDVKGEILELKNTINTMVDQLSSFAAEVTRVAREVGTEGKLGGQAQVKGVSGTWKDLTDNVNFMAGNLTEPGARYCPRRDGRGQRRFEAETDRGSQGRNRRPGRHDQQHDRHAGHVRRSSDHGGPRSGRRRKTGRTGQRARRGGHLERPDRQREPVGRQSHDASARHRGSGDRRDEGRPDAVDQSRGARRSGGLERQHQRDDCQPERHDAQELRARLAQNQSRQIQPHVARSERHAHGRPADSFRVGAGGFRAAGGGLHVRQCGRKTVPETAGQLRLRASRATVGKRIELGQGLVGQCALEKEKILLTNVPPDTSAFPPGWASATPANIIVLPIVFEGQVKAVLELASFERFNPTHQAFLDQLTESIGIVLNTIEANMRTEDLLKQSQSLAKELQSRQEELQQTNQELQEKARLLAHQNVEVERKNREVEQARQALEEKAEQLALTSKYKSRIPGEHVARVAHATEQLAHPVRSISKNPDGNLSPKQTEYAKTIHSSGNDLLMLINDILDLSKIESGTVVLDVGELRFADLHNYVERTFRHVAESKDVDFRVEVDPNLPRTLTTDSKRLQQVIKNLLSNAFKFTHRGQVCFACKWRTKAGIRRTKFSTPATNGAGVFGVGHRHRHSGRKAADYLRSVPAGRRQHQPQIRRHGFGFGDQPRNCPAVGRRNRLWPAARARAARSRCICRKLSCRKKLFVVRSCIAHEAGLAQPRRTRRNRSQSPDRRRQRRGIAGAGR